MNISRWFAAAFVFGSAAGLASADDQASPPANASVPWYSRILPGSDKKADSPKTFADAPARPPIIYGPLDPTTMTEALRAEQEAYQRRLDVCLKLREIAAKTNNDKLLDQADKLEQQATSLYHQRTTRIGVKSALRTVSAQEKLERKIAVDADPLTLNSIKTRSDQQAKQNKDKQDKQEKSEGASVAENRDFKVVNP